jgi:hypothetical protein
MEDLIFVSAQPDDIYFHWQVELYLYQFSKHGLKDKCYAVFGYRGSKPSSAIVELAKRYNIRWYKDTRDISVQNYYIPSIRPHILSQFFDENPSLGKKVFYHDSDIFIVKVPKFDILLEDDVGYLSDTISYIGYNYIAGKAAEYRKKYPQLPENDIVTRMCDFVGISEDLVKENNKNSGGAQYILKGIDGNYWRSVEKTTTGLYSMLKTYETAYPISNHIQSWTADMWGVLWEYWKLGKKTAVHPELDFSWATDPIENYHKKNIFHLAGVTNETSSDKFYKGLYTTKNVFKEYLKNPSLFDNVSSKSATYPYANMIKEYARTLPESPPERELTEFGMVTEGDWAGTYYKTEKQYFGKSLWRGDKYIIFFNGTCWILTGSQYEKEISETCGGFGSSHGTHPYDNCWRF